MMHSLFIFYYFTLQTHDKKAQWVFVINYPPILDDRVSEEVFLHIQTHTQTVSDTAHSSISCIVEEKQLIIVLKLHYLFVIVVGSSAAVQMNSFLYTSPVTIIILLLSVIVIQIRRQTPVKFVYYFFKTHQIVYIQLSSHLTSYCSRFQTMNER